MSADTLSGAWVSFLGSATWQGALWAAVAWALTRMLPQLPAAWRATLWWAVCLKVLLCLTQLPALALPLWPAVTPASPPTAELLAPTAPAPAPVLWASPGASPSPTRTLAWAEGLLCAWALGVLWKGAGLVSGALRLERLRRAARSLAGTPVEEEARALARKLGLHRTPRLSASAALTSPLALGLVRPEVLLPAHALDTLSDDERRMALAHELAHHRRGDVWLGWVPALVEVLFFFHPALRLAVRAWAQAREEACDAAALRTTGASPRDYGRLLLRFGVAQPTPPLAASAASAHFHSLHRRIVMLDSTSHAARPSRPLRWALGSLALLALLPVRVVAETPATPATPAMAQAPATHPTASLRPVPPVPPVPPTPPAHPAPPPPPPTMDFDEEPIILLGEGNSVMMSGSLSDLRRAQALQQGKAPLLFVRHQGRAYVIRDAKALADVREAFAPQRALGEQQAALGAKQAKLGEAQADLGVKQATLGQQQARLASQHAQLAATHALRPSEREDAELEKKMEALSSQMNALGGQMEALGREQAGLGQKQAALGREQAALGQKQEAAARQAHAAVRRMLDDVFQKGLAQPVTD